MNAQVIDFSCATRKNGLRKGTVCILVCAAAVAVLMGLVALRLYSLNLEYRLAGIQRQIVTREEEQSRLEKDLASLLNPTRVYSYARSELGMRASANIGVVRVEDTSGNTTAQAAKVPNEAGIFKRALARLVDSITGKASARQ